MTNDKIAEKDGLDALDAAGLVVVPREQLHEAMWQILDDMADGKCVCQFAKDQLIECYLSIFPDEADDDLPGAIIAAGDDDA